MNIFYLDAVLFNGKKSYIRMEESRTATLDQLK